MTGSSNRPRAREFGVTIGTLPVGRQNAITDVPGVLVGHRTIRFGDGALVPGEGPARTGVTAILPHGGNLFQAKVPGAIDVINGYGKTMGIEQVDELGTIESPIVLTSTLCVGRAADAVVTHAIRENPGIGITSSTVNPLVGECSDAWLNDMQGRHVHESDVLAAIDGAAAGPVDEGAVGAGTGMSLFGFKGGIGTSSRVIAAEYGGWTVGVLVLGNFGVRRQLVIDGVPVGRLLEAEENPPQERGSIMLVVGTDAPLLDRGLRRLCRRAGFGLARTGSEIGHGSGDVAIAFSNNPAVRTPQDGDGWTQRLEVVAEQGPAGSSAAIDALFQATVEATEEAILNALFRAETVVGRDGNTREALPLDRVGAILRSAGKIP